MDGVWPAQAARAGLRWRRRFRTAQADRALSGAAVSGALDRNPPRRPRGLVDRAQPALLPRAARPLGWHGVHEVVGERGETIHYLYGPGTAIGLRGVQTASDEPVDRYRVGLHHLALEAASRAVVNERAEWLRERVTGSRAAPEEYWYSPGYDAVFFYDPDGLKLEIVHVPGRAA